MTKLAMTKTLTGLAPADDEAKETLAKIKHGTLVSCDVKQPRNANHHRMFFALLKIVFDNQDRYKTQDHLLAAVKILAGHSEMILLPGGDAYFIPKSISFAKMDQTSFNKFYDRVCDVVVRDFLPGIEKQTLKREVAEMTGIGASFAA